MLGHNGGPPLEDEHVPEWGEAGRAHVYFGWKRAHAAAWKAVSWDTMVRRQRRAEAIGLTYEEYTLELLERGRYLGPDDAERIAAIKAKRQPPVGNASPPPSTRPPGSRPVPRPLSPEPSRRASSAGNGRGPR